MATGIHQSNNHSSDKSNNIEVQKMVVKYFKMLTEGCGRNECTNTNCATYKKAQGGPEGVPDPNQAAVIALRLVKSKGNLCLKEPEPNSEPTHRTRHSAGVKVVSPSDATSKGVTEESHSMETSQSTASSEDRMDISNGREVVPIAETHQSTSSGNHMMVGSVVKVSETYGPSSTARQDIVTSLSSEKILNQIEISKQVDPPTYGKLKDMVWNCFSNIASLNCSFLSNGKVDKKSLKKALSALEALNDPGVSNTLMNAILQYCKEAEREAVRKNSTSLNHVIIMLENPLLMDPDYLVQIVPPLLNSIRRQNKEKQMEMVEILSEYSVEELQELLSFLHQVIAFTIALSETDDEFELESCTAVTSAVVLMQMVYFANLLYAKKRGSCRPPGLLLKHVKEQKSSSSRKMENLSPYEQMLIHLELHPADLINPPIPLDRFINEELNSRMDVEHDFSVRHSSQFEVQGLSFFHYPCCLSPANKVEGLRLDNRLSMFQERHLTLVHLLFGQARNPYFILRVDRENLLQDTLTQLEIYSEDRPDDLRKQLRVHFRGEEGLDEGGLQKEFFQLLIEELFKPEYAMFMYNNDERFYWFNPYSYESDREYHLIGLLVGIAIYNNVILDIHFPMVVYRKLIGCQAIFEDLFSTHPLIARGLKSLLDYEEENFEETFDLTFCIEQTDLFGTIHHHDLKKGGGDIKVTKDNRQEYVNLYMDWLLNTSIESQLRPFQNGFQQVIKGTSLINLFTAEELELLVCGSKEWNFEELEESTSYDGGYSRDHVVIRNFWEVVHSFDDTLKKKFLQFVTGSDRVPLGGLAKLKFMIVKNGPDSDRLPTAHTCFNALLLCEYSTKEKLKDRLLKAVTHAKGFGML